METFGDRIPFPARFTFLNEHDVSDVRTERIVKQARVAKTYWNVAYSPKLYVES